MKITMRKQNMKIVSRETVDSMRSDMVKEEEPVQLGTFSGFNFKTINKIRSNDYYYVV